MWKYYAILAAFFAALTAIFAKLGVREINSDLATAIRVSFVLVLVWGIALATGATRDIQAISAKGLWFLFLSAIATGCSWLFYFRALETGSVSQVAPLDKLSVPLTIAVGIIFLGEPLSWRVLAGGALITGGSLILLK